VDVSENQTNGKSTSRCNTIHKLAALRPADGVETAFEFLVRSQLFTDLRDLLIDIREKLPGCGGTSDAISREKYDKCI
jgi:hypothetical protein